MGVSAYGSSPGVGLMDSNGVPYSSTNPVPVSGYVSINAGDSVGSNTYSFGIQLNTPVSGLDNPLVLLRNPAGSGKTVVIWSIYAASSIQNVQIEYKIFSSPTITTNGAPITISRNYVGGTQPGASALAGSAPVLSALGSAMAVLVSGQNTASVGIPEFSIQIAPGSSILLSGNPVSNNRQSDVSFLWKEI